MTWFHFRSMKTSFLFLLQTIYKLASCVLIPKAIGAFYHVWKWHNVQRAKSQMRRCTTHVSTDPSYDNRTIASTLKMPTLKSTAQRIGRPFGWLQLRSLVWFQVRATSCHLPSSKSAWKSTTKCTWMMWWSPCAIRGWWQTLAAGLGTGPQVQRDPGLVSDGVIQLCTLLWLPHLLPRPEPTGLLRLVIHREHHQHDLPQHQSQPYRRHPLSIRRAPAGACRKGMLPVSDPYQGGDWGRR